MNVVDQLRLAARRFGDSPLALCADEQRTYAEIDRRSEQLANALRERGVAQGDRVATLLVNSVRCVETDFGLAKGGYVRASINPKLTGREAEFIIGDSDARALVYDASLDAVVDEIEPRLPPDLKLVRVGGARNRSEDYEAMLAAASAEPVDIASAPEDLSSLFYTSGTTGRPKGVMLTHRAILHVAYNLLLELGVYREGEKILLMQPMSHGAGFYVLPYLMKGGAVVIMREFDPVEALELSERHAIEVIKVVPTMLQRMLRVPGVEQRPLPAMRLIVYGAAAMPLEPLKRAIEIYGPRLLQVYGQSECPVTLAVLPASAHRLDTPHPQRLTSAGWPWATVEVRIADEAGKDVPRGEIGEVLVRGPHMMSGYWKRPDLSAKALRDGWLWTNDIGRIDDSGVLYLLGRKDEMIVSGGYNIAAREVEDALYEHPSVVEVAVVPEEDAEWGQVVVAYLVLQDPGLPLEPVIAHAKAALGFKRPKRMYVLREMPKNTAGKIQKKGLTPQLAVPSRSEAHA